MGILGFLEPSSWTFWIAVGIILAILELMDGSFFLLSLGLGCVAPAVAAGLGVTSTTTLVAICACAQLVLFFAVRPVFRRMGERESQPTNVDALKMREGIVTREIEGCIVPGYVRVGGEEWRALGQDDVKLLVGEKIRVIALSGATLTVIASESKRLEPTESNTEEV